MCRRTEEVSGPMMPGETDGGFKVCLAFGNALQCSFLRFGRWSVGKREI